MSFSLKRSLILASALAVLTAVAGTASADTTWQKNHPRREQVNHRLNNQDKRIHNDVKNGRLTKGQAAGFATDQLNTMSLTGRGKPLLAVFDLTNLKMIGILTKK